MRPVSNYYKQKIASGETRNFHIKIMMTLADGTQYDDVHNPAITEADIMDSSFKILTASSGQSSFDIGSAIIGKCQFTLKNFEDEWADIDFFNAEATVWIGLDGDETNSTQIYHRVGFFTVDEPQYAGSMVSLELLDNMWKFDKDLPSIPLPKTIGEIVNRLCTHCGVGLGTQTFNGSTYQITELPDTTEITNTSAPVELTNTSAPVELTNTTAPVELTNTNASVESTQPVESNESYVSTKLSEPKESSGSTDPTDPSGQSFQSFSP